MANPYEFRFRLLEMAQGYLQDEQEKQRIQKEQEIKNTATAKEFQRVDKSIPLIASVLPITALGILLLYSRGGKM